MSRQDERAAEKARRQAEQVDTSDLADAAVGSAARSRVPLPQFLREVRGELRRVAWPTGNEVVNFSVTVLVFTGLLTALVWGMDWFLAKLALTVFS